MKAFRGSSVLAAATCAFLLSCGGDTLTTAGVGTEGTGFAAGTVTGFGSIIVDGERWNESGKPVEVESDPRLPAVSGQTVRLGQRVQIEHNTVGVADRVRIEAEVIGPVQTPVSGNQFKVVGQTIRINVDPNAGPVTLLVGYASAADISAGDIVEVHGSTLAEATGYVVVASRIEKQSGLPAGLVRVTGVVSNLGPAAFRLGELDVSIPAMTNIEPANRVLADGQRVVVWGAAPTATPALTLVADAIRIRDRLPSSGALRSQISGVVGRLVGATFTVNGFRVDFTQGIVVPANTMLADGQYVIVRGSFDADNVLMAEQVRIRKKSTNEPEVELTGPITNYVSDASFQVRGVQVNALGLTRRPPCPAQLADGVNVRIEGGIQGNTDVVAESLRCNP